MVLRKQINFRGAYYFVGEVRILPMQRLRADDDELLLSRDLARRPQDVVNFPFLHR